MADTTTPSILRQKAQLSIDTAKMRKKQVDELHNLSAMIEELQDANSVLREKNSKSSTAHFDVGELKKLTKMQDASDALELKLQYERLRNNELNTREGMLREELARARKARGGVNAAQENKEIVESKVRILENRLDQAIQKFNATLGRNKLLRAEIDSLRDERSTFEKLYRHLEHDLYEKKRMMADKIERANIDYEERDRLKRELEARKTSMDEDRRMCAESFAQLDKVLEQLRRSQEAKKRENFKRMSLQNREKLNIILSKKFNRMSVDKQHSQRGEVSASPTRAGSDRRGNTGATTSVLEDNLAAEEERDMPRIIEDLRHVTGCADMQSLYESLKETEENNFSTYVFLKNQSSEEERLQKEIDALRAQLAMSPEERERIKTMEGLEEQLRLTEQQHEAVSRELAAHKHLLEQVRDQTAEIFESIGADRAKLIHKFGTDEISELNLAGVLGMLEHRVNELIYLNTEGLPLGALIAAGGKGGGGEAGGVDGAERHTVSQDEEAEMEEYEDEDSAVEGGEDASEEAHEKESAEKEAEEPPPRPPHWEEDAALEEADRQQKVLEGAESEEAGVVESGAKVVSPPHIALTTETTENPQDTFTGDVVPFSGKTASSLTVGNPYVGAGPIEPSGAVTAPKFVQRATLPSTNLTHDGGDYDDGYLEDTDEVLSVEEMRAAVQRRMQRRQEGEEGGKRRKGKGK